MADLERFDYFVQSGVSEKHSPTINKVSFGGGYEQRASGGINSDLREFSVTYKDTWNADRKNGVEYPKVEAFLARHKGYMAFLWGSFRSPTNKGELVKVYCPEWDITREQGSVTITMKFQETL